MKTWLPLCLIVLAFGIAAACGVAAGTEGADCPNDNNCLRPLRCIDGTCQPGDVAPDAGTPDAGMGDAGMAPPRDGGVVYDDAFNAGIVTITPDGTMLGFDQVAGTAGMVRTADGRTNVRVEVSNLTPNTTFGSHVHALPCDDQGGGGHYKIDDTVMDVQEANEIWPTVVVDANGDGVGSASVEHYARPEAQSIVIHEPVDGKRIVCIDLAPNADVTSTGTFIELTAGAGSGITGTVAMRRYTKQTNVEITLGGTLAPNANYPAHVHAKRCDDEEGGGHYKIDEGVAEVDADNEIWPIATSNAAGDAAMGTRTVMHMARFDAYSVVVHDPISGDRLVCADFSWAP